MTRDDVKKVVGELADILPKYDKHKSITKNSSKFSVKLRMLSFLIGNRLYFYKFKKIFGTK